MFRWMAAVLCDVTSSVSLVVERFGDGTLALAEGNWGFPRPEHPKTGSNPTFFEGSSLVVLCKSRFAWFLSGGFWTKPSHKESELIEQEGGNTSDLAHPWP